MIIHPENNIPQLLIDVIREISNDKNLNYKTKLRSIKMMLTYYIEKVDKEIDKFE